MAVQTCTQTIGEEKQMYIPTNVENKIYILMYVDVQEKQNI